MSDDPVVPDAVVRTALQLLPVPEHGPDFWPHLVAELDAEDALRLAGDGDVPRAPAPSAETSSARRRRRPRATVPLVALEPASVGSVPAGMRRRSNVVLSAVAVAAAVAVVVAGTSLVRSRTGSDTTTQVAEAPEETTTSDAPTGSSSSISTLAAHDGEPAVAAVVTWVDALGRGDLETAWDGLGPASQEHWGSKAAFAAQRTALAEGYGAWSATEPEEILVTPLSSGGDGELVIVTLVGSLEQEGSTVSRADAFPVRIVDGEGKVELYAFAGELEVVVPEPVSEDGTRAALAADDELVVVVPADAPAPVIRLDDGEVVVCGKSAGTDLTPLEGASGQRCGYRPKGGIPKGERVLTVAVSSADGAEVSAESVRFTAA